MNGINISIKFMKKAWTLLMPWYHCNFYQYNLTLHSFPCDGDVTLTNQDILGHIRTTVTDNMRIIGKSENWTELCFLESLNISGKAVTKQWYQSIKRALPFFINLIEILIPFILWSPISLKPF